ncbi:hypothetical protein Tco_0803241 [Tanacetum coccineum]|uniref:Uncharacterized protein n=1 Tax=Tanacetum coccineum TaxID=301880 RepID=A0ABQ5A5E0_9ASTR
MMARHLLAPHYEGKTRADRGKKRPREPNVSSSSFTLNHPSSSHPLNDSTHKNDDESFHSNPSSPPQNISSSSNIVSRVPQNPPHESHDLNTFYLKPYLVNQQRDVSDRVKVQLTTLKKHDGRKMEVRCRHNFK